MRAHFKKLDEIVINSMDFNEKSMGKIFLDSKSYEVEQMKDLNGEFGGIIVKGSSQAKPKPVEPVIEPDDEEPSEEIIQPTGEIEITSNGEYDVTQYATAIVSVDSETSPSWLKTSPLGNTDTIASLFTALPPYSISTNKNTFANFFANLNNVKRINGTNLIKSNVTNLNNMFYGCSQLEQITGLTTWLTSNINNTSKMFSKCSSLTELDLHNWDLSNVRDAQEMFSYMNNIESINIAGCNFTNLTSADSMFMGDSNLRTVNLGDWSKATSLVNINHLFNGCSSLESINLPNITLSESNLEIYNLFNGCSNLNSLNIRSWVLPKTHSLYRAFTDCHNVTAIDLSNWVMPKLDSLFETFAGCNNLTELHLPSPNDDVPMLNMSRTFAGCESLQHLDMRSFNLEDFDVEGAFGSYGNYGAVPDNCLIIVKNLACKDQIQAYYPNLTNIVTVDEYES